MADAGEERTQAQIHAAMSALRVIANGGGVSGDPNPMDLMRLAEEALSDLREVGLRNVEEEHPGPWRTGVNLHITHMGPVTIYDGHPHGDGFFEDHRRKPGRVIGIMFSPALAEFVCQVVSAHFRAKLAMGEDQ